MTLIEQFVAEYERMKTLEDKLNDSIGAAVRACVNDEEHVSIIESEYRRNDADPYIDCDWRCWRERVIASRGALWALLSLVMDDEESIDVYIGELLDDERASRR